MSASPSPSASHLEAKKCKNRGSRNPNRPPKQSSWVLVDTQLPRPPLWPQAPVSFSHGDSEGSPNARSPAPRRQWQVLYQPSCKEARMSPTCQPTLSSLMCCQGQLGPRDPPSTFHFLLTLPLCWRDLTLSPCGLCQFHPMCGCTGVPRGAVPHAPCCLPFLCTCGPKWPQPVTHGLCGITRDGEDVIVIGCGTVSSPGDSP